MKNRLSFVAVLAALGASALFSHAVLADEAASKTKAPTVTANVAKQLVTAQAALKADKPDEAIASLKDAQAAKGEKTPYDLFIINEMLGTAYVKQKDYQSAAPLLEAAARSEYCDPTQAKAWLRAVMVINYNNKDYPKTIELGEQIASRGAADEDTTTMMGDSYFHLNKYKEAGDYIQQYTDKQDKPQEKFLKFEYSCFTKANDSKAAEKVLDKLITYYPSADYWAIALSSLRGANITDAHQQLALYRLEFDLGVLKRPSDLEEMAELSLDQGFPGETVAVLQRAFQQNLITDAREKERYQHLLDGAKQRATKDEASLAAAEPAAEKAADGNMFIQLGAAYLSYGQAAKAVAVLQQGIAKGMLKNPDEATLLLGQAQLKAGQGSAAKSNFEKVASSANGNYARIGKLWTLYASSPASHSSA
jgi:hypothetical protein